MHLTFGISCPKVYDLSSGWHSPLLNIIFFISLFLWLGIGTKISDLEMGNLLEQSKNLDWTNKRLEIYDRFDVSLALLEAFIVSIFWCVARPMLLFGGIGCRWCVAS